VRRRDPSGLGAEQLTCVWQAASLLLDYPDETLRGRLDLARAAAAELPPAVGRPLTDAADRLAAEPVERLQAAYVETFDQRRRCSLFLTYFAHGDTRKRGMALLRFQQTYLAAGLRLDPAELPDHLCVVLEFAATVDRDAGRRLLLDHRAGLELLRMSLRADDAPWAPVVEAVCATLPPLRGDEHAAVRRLAEEGPPEEEVGLSPYGGTGYDPALAARHVVDLPDPTLMGASR
jgi:nitrate reductase delta subunit